MVMPPEPGVRMTDKVKMFRAASDAEPTDQVGAERRSHFRVFASVDLRVRMVPLHANELPDLERDLVTAFEELSSSATRYRKELSASGRVFVDRLMTVMDGVVGQLSRGPSETTWSSEGVIEANLSAGGIGFSTSYGLTLGEIVEVQFAVLSASSAIPFRAHASVVRCQLITTGLYEVGLELLEMAPSTRERLVRLIFDLQRALLRKRSEP